ncbi:MAG: hypothetical protein IPM82_28220 [Saprospiraceae bacterium]|nr:hypothetical protein [Saprospiraceae bacterium]
MKANIYDLNGRLVKAFDEEKLPAGQQSLTWEAQSAQPGMYIYHLLVDGREWALPIWFEEKGFLIKIGIGFEVDLAAQT